MSGNDFPRFELRGTSGSIEVWRNGTVVSRGYHSRDAATARMNALDAISLLTRRACLCCAAPFLSAGIGNRLCPPCRTAA